MYLLKFATLTVLMWMLSAQAPCRNGLEDEIFVILAKKDRKLDGYTSKTKSLSLGETCFAVCLYEKTCVSYNEVEEEEELICQMFNTIVTDESKFDASSSSDYYVVKNLCEPCKPKIESNPCECRCS